MLANKLNIGDTIGIISPSAPITQELKEQFNRGLQVFKDMGFKIELSKNVYANTLGYSSTVSEKVEDINEMFANKEVKAIICSQGGQNSNTILPYIDYEIIITYHQNDVVWGLGRETSEKEINDFKLRLIDANNGKVEHFTKWKCLKAGIVEETLIGGNLSTLIKLLNTEYCPDFNNKILFLEDYADESPLDEVDSKINILKQYKVFEKIKGLWIGYYEKDTEIAKFEDVIMNNLQEYKFPILKCNDFGHNCENVVIPIGAKIKLDATNCEVEIIEKTLN